MKKTIDKLFNLFLRIKYGKDTTKAESELLKMKGTKEGMEGLGQVVVNEKGGIDTYKSYAEYPFPGFATRQELEGLSKIKRLIPLGLNLIDKLIVNYKPKDPNHYSKPIREIYRVMTIMIERHHYHSVRQTFKFLRDVICVILEKDDAYRAPFQDAFGELDVSKIQMDEREKYWFCRKPYNFGGKDKEKEWDMIRQHRAEYEIKAQEDLELKIQQGKERLLLKERQVKDIASKVKPDLEALLEKHNIKPDFNNVSEEQVDIKIRIKIPKE